MFTARSERTTTGANNARSSGSAPPQPAATASPVAREAARTVGRTNPALVDLQHMRSQLTPFQNALVDSVERFYANSAEPKTNRALGLDAGGEAVSNMNAEHAHTLERRASFLLNNDAMEGLRPQLGHIGPDAGVIGHSMTTMTINAIACSVKSQTEQVKAVALAEAQEGKRICPMTLQPVHFQRMLDQNTATLTRIVDACRMAPAARETALKPLLETLATSYFQHSRRSPGAPRAVPHQVAVNMSDHGQSEADVDLYDRPIARLAIDSAGIDSLCNAPLPAADECENYEMIFRTNLLQGFENHSPEKKRAALYLQLLWSEVASVQEIMGMRSVNEPRHGADAQHAAARTHEELFYPGSHDFGDQVGNGNDSDAQRRAVTRGMEVLPGVDYAFKERFGSSMLTDPRVRDWTQSTAYPFDLRMLRQPGSRLLMQAIPITGNALLQTSVFRTPA